MSSVRKGRASTGAVAAGGSVEITVNWASAFPDANYTAVASVLEGTAGSSTLRTRQTVSKTAAAIVVRVTNDDALNAKTGEVHAIAFAD